MFPVNWQKGEPFYIKNLKNVTGQIPIEIEGTPIKEIVIYVFSRVGEMLLEKLILLKEEL